MMMDDREDGELSGSGTEEPCAGILSAAAAAAVAAAATAAAVSNSQTTLFAYRSSSGGGGAAALASSDEDQSSDGDSDDDNCHLKAPAKRRKMPHNQYSSTQPAFNAQQRTDVQRELGVLHKPAMQQQPPAQQPAAPHRKQKKSNNIWANVIGEQSLTDDISSVGLKKLEGDRSVENYDFRAAQQLIQEQQERLHSQQDGDMNEDGEVIDEDDEAVERMAKRLSRKRPMSSRVYRPPAAPRPCAEPGKALKLTAIVPDNTWTNDKLAGAIADALQEQKPQIIVRVVEVLGKERALKLYEDTREVENSGGMIILNGERRRTSGGVFMQLLKKETLTKEQMAIIFPPDEAQQQWRKRRRAVHRRRNRDRHDNNDRQGSDGQSGESSSRVSDRSPRLQGSDSNDATDLAGSKCPGSTPVTSPGPTPTTTPIVTPHCSDDERDVNKLKGKLVDTALAIVKAVSPGVAPLAEYDEDFLDVSAPPADDMDVV